MTQSILTTGSCQLLFEGDPYSLEFESSTHGVLTIDGQFEVTQARCLEEKGHDGICCRTTFEPVPGSSMITARWVSPGSGEPSIWSESKDAPELTTVPEPTGPLALAVCILFLILVMRIRRGKGRV